MSRELQPNKHLDFLGGSWLRLKNNASPFGLGESYNRVGKTLNLSCHRGRVECLTPLKLLFYIPPGYV